jgi:hypothetical protein
MSYRDKRLREQEKKIDPSRAGSLPIIGRTIGEYYTLPLLDVNKTPGGISWLSGELRFP